MKIDPRFPTKLDTVSDAPEPLRSELVKGLHSNDPVRLLVHAPAFPTGDEKSPATLLAVTNNGWLVASETEDGGAALVRSDFSNTLFFELTSILLLGQLIISFSEEGKAHSVTITFERVEDEFYHKAIDLMLAGIDPARTAIAGEDRNETSMFEAWPLKFRNEAQRYWPRGQRMLTAVQWPANPRQLAPAGALLMTERELVLISEGKKSSAEFSPVASSAEEPQETLATPMPPKAVNPTDTPSVPGNVYEFADIIIFVPRVRLADFQVSHQENGLLTLQLRASQGEEKLEITFPSDHKDAVLKGIEQMMPSRNSAIPTIKKR
jgi:hypothetical protein